MISFLLSFTLLGGKPHFTFLESALANEMLVLRWLHLFFGIIWIGLLYFFNLVLTPVLKQIDPPIRVKFYPALMCFSCPPRDSGTTSGFAPLLSRSW